MCPDSPCSRPWSYQPHHPTAANSTRERLPRPLGLDDPRLEPADRRPHEHAAVRIADRANGDRALGRSQPTDQTESRAWRPCVVTVDQCGHVAPTHVHCGHGELSLRGQRGEPADHAAGQGSTTSATWTTPAQPTTCVKSATRCGSGPGRRSRGRRVRSPGGGRVQESGDAPLAAAPAGDAELAHRAFDRAAGRAWPCWLGSHGPIAADPAVMLSPMAARAKPTWHCRSTSVRYSARRLRLDRLPAPGRYRPHCTGGAADVPSCRAGGRLVGSHRGPGRHTGCVGWWARPIQPGPGHRRRRGHPSLGEGAGGSRSPTRLRLPPDPVLPGQHR